jgi:tetratricopeptide (TPR) repeat protein
MTMTALPSDARRPSRRPLLVGLGLVTLVVGAQLAGTFVPRSAPVAVDPMFDEPLLQAPPAENAEGEVIAGTSATTFDAAAELARVRADVDFWANRLTANRLDIVAAGKLAEANVALARMTGDVDGYVRAESAVDVALSAQPGYLPAQAQRAAVLVALHRFGEARDAAGAVLAGSPGDPTALGALGDASLELGDLAGAAAAYTSLTDAADGSAARIRTARLAFVTGDPAGAVSAARAALDGAIDEGLEGDGIAFYHATLGDLLLATGDATGARAAFDAALAVRPAHPASLVGLARLDAFEGRIDPAIAELDASIAAVPLPEVLARRSDLLEVRSGPGDASRAADDRLTVEAIARLAGAAGSVYDRNLSIYLSDHGLDP